MNLLLCLLFHDHLFVDAARRGLQKAALLIAAARAPPLLALSLGRCHPLLLHAVALLWIGNACNLSV